MPVDKKIILIGAGSTNFGLGTIGDIFKSKIASCKVKKFSFGSGKTKLFLFKNKG